MPTSKYHTVSITCTNTVLFFSFSIYCSFRVYIGNRVNSQKSQNPVDIAQLNEVVENQTMAIDELYKRQKKAIDVLVDNQKMAIDELNQRQNRTQKKSIVLACI